MNQQDDRVRTNTSDSTNVEIDKKILLDIQSYLDLDDLAITQRIEALDKEWSIERWLEANASVIAFLGILLGFFVHIYWLILPAVVLIFLFQHAVQGWCPPLPLFRSYGVRTRKEIDWERYSLKFIRGDFNQLESQNAQKILEAMKKS